MILQLETDRDHAIGIAKQDLKDGQLITVTIGSDGRMYSNEIDFSPLNNKLAGTPGLRSTRKPFTYFVAGSSDLFAGFFDRIAGEKIIPDEKLFNKWRVRVGGRILHFVHLTEANQVHGLMANDDNQAVILHDAKPDVVAALQHRGFQNHKPANEPTAPPRSAESR